MAEATITCNIYVLCLVIQKIFFQMIFKLFFRVNVFYEQSNFIPSSYWSKNSNS